MYFCPILDKKDPPKDKELLDPSEPLLKVIPSPSIANCHAEVTKVLKQAKWSATNNCYTKLTPAQIYEIGHGKKGAEIDVTVPIWYYNKYISQPL